MNLSTFLQHYTVTAEEAVDHTLPTAFADEAFSEVIRQLGGKTFNHGIYRLLRADQIDEVRATLTEMYRYPADGMDPFGFDWTGRFFVVKTSTRNTPTPTILMLDISSGEAFVIPAGIEQFHNHILVANHQPALATSSWNEWQELHPEPLRFSECIGCRKPLFLGGKDDFTNFERGDLDVYLDFCAQLWIRVRDLPPGTRIGNVKMG